MAPRVAKHPVGSASWVLDERLQAAEEVTQAADEFVFSASNNMEWLNEHMAEIFSHNPLTMTEISKTPGKLRGRTPMTARKRNLFEARAPLTDVFASTPNAHASPSHNTQFYKQVSKFQVAEDKENAQIRSPAPAKTSPGIGKENTDSGYHEMTDEDTGSEQHEEHLPEILPTVRPSPMLSAPQHPLQRLQSPPKLLQIQRIEQQQSRRSETVDSFVSAKESPASRPSEHETETLQDGVIEWAESAKRNSSALQIAPAALPLEPEANERPEGVSVVAQNNVIPAASSLQTAPASEPPSPTRTVSDDLSEASSPERPILRKKSSLTFATLPSRDTIMAKKSMGPRTSRTSYAENSRSTQAAPRPAEPESQPPKRRSSRRQSNHDDQVAAVDLDIDQITHPGQETSEVSKEHSKTSTQRLHERITMLGKMNPHRPSKSVSATTAASQTSARDTMLNGDKIAAPTPTELRDEDDDWIGPISNKKQESAATVVAAENQRPSMFLQHTVSSHIPEPEDDVFDVPTVEATSKPTSFQQSKTTYPDLSAIAAASTTPAGSPVRTHTYTENPLSASKAKLFDMFKSARSIFASSAGASAQAKTQALPSQPIQARPHVDSDNEDDEPPPVSHALEASADAPMEFDAVDVAPKARRSSARVQQQKEQKAVKAGEQFQELEAGGVQAQATIRTVIEPKASEPKKAPLATSQMSKHGDFRRPGLKPAPETQAKGRPAPVSIRVASQRVGQGAPSTAVLGASLHESLSQSSQQKQPPTLKTKGSNSSIKSGLTGTIGKSSNAAGSRPKALEAAARKKEQDEREAQRKADHKREMEKRRAAKAEEERRVAQEQKDQRAAEQRAIEAKQAAQRQAMEQRRVEALKKAEQPPRPQSSLTQHERPPSQAQTNASRNEFRPLSKMSMHQDNTRPPVPHVNPAKPPKRYFQPDDEEDQPERNLGQKSTGNVQQGANPAKRRRTSEMEVPTDGSSRPTMAMAPPMRLSTMQKSAPPNKFTPGYVSAASSSSQTGSSAMLKTAMNGNFQAHHPKTPHDLSKFSTAKIPFGDMMSQHGPQTIQRSQPGVFKTPGTANSKHAGAKSSPNYPEGDNISLPEIATDSEDEDSDDEGFVPPDWANSPALRELLSQQQLVDPMKVFGPIGPLHMEELFKGNKERIIKFRKRTSSANWSGPDGLTEEERRKDVEARAKLVRDGGWTFNPNL